MFQNFMISMVIVPILLGASAARGHDSERDRRVQRVGWIAYAVVWFLMLYYLRYRWR